MLVAGTRAHAEDAARRSRQRCSPRWACACRRRRRGSPTSTRASTSWGSASSGTRSEAPASRFVYTYPSKKALASIKAKVRTITRRATNQPLAVLLLPAQPGAAGLDQLLPPRRVQGDLRLPAPVHLAPGDLLAPPQAPPRQLEVAPTALPPEVVADGRRGDPVQPGNGGGHPLPLPRATASPRHGPAALEDTVA